MADNRPMSQKYPKYYKPVPEGVIELDTYALNRMFPVDDPTGCVLHARKKLLIPGTRSGGKSFYDDVREARDTLTRYLEIMGIEKGSRSFDAPKVHDPLNQTFITAAEVKPKTFEQMDFGTITAGNINNK